jgi:hypothetical protein
MHEMLEDLADGLNPFEKLEEIEKEQGKLFRAQREEYGEIIGTAGLIMQEYLEFYHDNPLKYMKLKGKKSEHEIKVDLDNDIVLVMKLDGIVKTPNGLRWLLENKTFKSLPSDDDRWRNIQVAVYVRGCEMYGLKPFDGVCWNYIRSKEPKIPAINQDGSMSKRKIETFPSVVLQVAKENKCIHYKDQLEFARQSVPGWFQRIFTPISPQVVDRIFDDFVESAEEIAEYGEIKCYKEIDKHCGWCDFEGICRAELTGGDSDFVKEKEYGRKKKRKKKTKPSGNRSRRTSR